MGIFDGFGYSVYTFDDSSAAFEWQPGTSSKYEYCWIGVWIEEMM